MMTRLDGPGIEPGRGDGVSAADFAAMAERRNDTIGHDLPNIGPIAHHTDRRVRCFRCDGRVYTYATTRDGERHYCRSCVLRMGAVSHRADCIMDGGHVGRCRDKGGRLLR